MDRWSRFDTEQSSRYALGRGPLVLTALGWSPLSSTKMPDILDQDFLAWRFRQISCAPHGILLVLKIEPRGYGDAIDPLFDKIPCRVHSLLAWEALSFSFWAG